MERLANVLGAKLFADSDVKKLCDGKIKILLYRELARFDSLQELLAPHGAVIVLYEFKPDEGHWCALLQQPGAVVEFFDPMGCAVDSELRHIDRKFLAKSGQDVPHLSNLIAHGLESGVVRAVTVNGTRLQGSGRVVNTCGRWCGLRVAMRAVPLPAFIRLFLNQPHPPDVYAVLLTAYV